MSAVIVDAAMFRLVRTQLAADANAYQVFVFASFAATVVVIGAITCFVIRVVDEFLSFLVDRLGQ